MSGNLERGNPPHDRRPCGPRRAALALAVVGLLASLLALVPAAPAQASTRPVLIVGGHGSQDHMLERLADHIDGRLGLSDDRVRTVELATGYWADWLGGAQLDSTFDDAYYEYAPQDDEHDWPGTESQNISATKIRLAVESLYQAAGGIKVDIVAISQGATATRAMLKLNTNNVQGKVAGYISYGGGNAGMPEDMTGEFWGELALDECELLLRDPDGLGPDQNVCEQFIYDPGSIPIIEGLGNTAWLRWVNGVSPSGDPTPGSLDYFHLYTTNSPDTWGIDDYESAVPYNWTSPLPGATLMTGQQACGFNRVTPHAGLWDVLRPSDQAFVDLYPDLVMTHLLIDALNRAPLEVPAALCAAPANQRPTDWPMQAPF